MKEYYGNVEKIWVDSNTENILLKTADKSLHLVKGKEKIWTRQEGLTLVKKWAVGKGKEKFMFEENEETSASPIAGFLKRIEKQTKQISNTFTNFFDSLHSLVMKKQMLFSEKSRKGTDAKILFVFLMKINKK